MFVSQSADSHALLGRSSALELVCPGETCCFGTADSHLACAASLLSSLYPARLAWKRCRFLCFANEDEQSGSL